MRIDDMFAQIGAEYPEILAIAHVVDSPCILAVNVIRTRTERGFTHAGIAAASGLAEPYIQRIERGEANPRLVTLAKIAFALGVPLSELLEDNLRNSRAPVAAHSA